MPSSKEHVVKIEIKLGFGWLVRITSFAKRLWSNRVFRIASILLATSAFLVVSYEGVNAAGAAYFIKKGGQLLGEGKYQEALSTFQKADSFWDRTLIFSRVRVSPTDWRVSLADSEVERLTRSHENYITGVESFEKKKWENAANLLSEVDQDDPDYTDAREKLKTAQAKIEEITKAEAKKQQTATTSESVQRSDNSYYNYHKYYPIILSLSDNRGNLTKYSYWSGYSGHLGGSVGNTILRVGDKVTLTVVAKDPKGRQIQYLWTVNYGSSFLGDWSNKNTFTYTIKDSDAQPEGEIEIGVAIKSEKEYFRIPNGAYGGHDDWIDLGYTRFSSF